MGSVKPYPPIINKHFQGIFETHFPALKIPAKDSREEDKQEGRQKDKKGRDDERY